MALDQEDSFNYYFNTSSGAYRYQAKWGNENAEDRSGD